MSKTIISYTFQYEQEDGQFSYQINKFNGNIIYTIKLPLMNNGGVLIESPSADPYMIPLPYGIKSFDYTINPLHAKIIQVMSSPWALGVLKAKVNPEYTVGSETVNRGMHKWGAINEYPDENTIYQILLEYDLTLYYSGHSTVPVINGKSPNYILKVDGSGNNILLRCENTTTPSVGDTLFSLSLYNIEFGGVPSPDY